MLVDVVAECFDVLCNGIALTNWTPKKMRVQFRCPQVPRLEKID